MSLRLLKLRLPADQRDELDETLDSHDPVDRWGESITDDHLVLNILIDSEETEALVGALQEEFGRLESFRLVTLEAEAAVPMPEPDEEADDETEEGSEQETKDDEESNDTAPINIEELYADVTEGIELSWTYVLVSMLSAVVAAVGIVRNDVAVVIAAMIIAPLLGPNMSLSLATTLADAKLAIRSLKINVLGLASAVFVSFVFGMVFSVDPSMSQIALRTKVGIPELILAGSAGAAGALSFTTGAAGRVTGVMIAVALLPPAVIFGMLGGAGLWTRAFGALYLVASNIICLNLAGVVTFFFQRVRPRRAWEAERAERASWTAIVIWIVLLIMLIGLVLTSGAYRAT